jgi:hypothetical protein
VNNKDEKIYFGRPFLGCVTEGLEFRVQIGLEMAARNMITEI